MPVRVIEGENQHDFIKRCMSLEKNFYPYEKQRYATCKSYWDNRNFNTMSFTDYPKSASNNAQRALNWVEKNGWGSCGTQVGKIRANQLAKGEPITKDTISRMASFKRHQQHKDVKYEDGCGGLMWDAWGGDEGIEWAIRKLEQLNK